MGSKGDFVAGIVLGAMVGATIGVLFAPAPGVETRKKIKESAQDYAQQASDCGSEFIQQAKASAAEMACKAKQGASDALSSVRHKLKTGGQSVEEVIDQVERELA